MLREVDRTDKYVVQKVVTRKGVTICYQVVEIGVNDASKVRPFAKLSMARAVIRGHDPKTAAKMEGFGPSHPEHYSNDADYDAVERGTAKKTTQQEVQHGASA